MKINQIHNQNCITGMRAMPENSADLIIADPPYFETKGAFDFAWASFDDYLKDVEKWAIECFRILKPNGTLYWWGHAKKIAYSQIILDKFFTLENSLVWEKTNGIGRKNNPKSLRTFAPVTERCLMYSSNKLECGQIATTAENLYRFKEGMLLVQASKPIIDYLISERDRAGFTNSMVNKALSTKMANHWFCRASQFDLPTEQNYQRLQNLFNSTGSEYLRKEYRCLRKEYEELHKEYEELRKEYESLRRPFDMRGRLLTDVLAFSQEAHITKNYHHDTKKPETLTRELVLTSSRLGDLVVVPFAGSGTECAMAKKEGRNFIGFDIEPKYVEMSTKRVDNVAVDHTFQFETEQDKPTKSAI